MSATEKRYAFLYKEVRVTLEGLKRAVARNIITQQEFDEITKQEIKGDKI